jgi:hypothetical protein
MFLKKPGQILTELLIALGVATVAVVAMVQLATRSLSNASFSKSQSQATAYASAGGEWLREQRTTLGWDQFVTKASATGVTYCINDLTWVPGTCGTQDIGDTGFSREVSVVQLSPVLIETTVTTTWEEGIKAFSAKQVTLFSKAGDIVTAYLPSPTPTLPPQTSSYTRVASSNWSGAQTLCRQTPGGDLVTINDSAENSTVATTCGGLDCWIGYTDQASEGSWIWTRGSSSYTNWAPSQPNDSGGQDCAHMYPNATWDDHACSANHYGVCEILSGPTPPPTPGLFAISSSNWASVNSTCQTAGGHLAVINTPTENTTAVNVCPGSNSCWIGYTDQASEGSWVWTGDFSSYTNWNTGEPNNSGNQDCAQLMSNGRWDDDGCSSSKTGLCEIQ